MFFCSWTIYSALHKRIQKFQHYSAESHLRWATSLPLLPISAGCKSESPPQRKVLLPLFRLSMSLQTISLILPPQQLLLTLMQPQFSHEESQSLAFIRLLIPLIQLRGCFPPLLLVKNIMQQHAGCRKFCRTTRISRTS